MTRCLFHSSKGKVSLVYQTYKYFSQFTKKNYIYDDSNNHILFYNLKHLSQQ